MTITYQHRAAIAADFKSAFVAVKAPKVIRISPDIKNSFFFNIIAFISFHCREVNLAGNGAEKV